jgi:uncharacterized membrane protein YozB (DUF420 family)
LTEKNEKQCNRNHSVWHRRMKNLNTMVSITLFFILLCQTLWFLLLCFSFYCVKHWFLLLCFSFFCVKHYGFYYIVFHSSLSNIMVSITLLSILLCVKKSNRNHSVWRRRMKNKVIETIVFDTEEEKQSNRNGSVWHKRMKKK